MVLEYSTVCILVQGYMYPIFYFLLPVRCSGRCRPSNFYIIWLAPRAGKMKRILCSDRLSERARCANRIILGITCFVPTKAKFIGVIFWPYNKSSIDQSCSVEMTGYWSRFFFCVFEMKK